MANIFDQFDEPENQQTGNVFDQFDKEPQKASMTQQEFEARSGDIPDIYGEISPQAPKPEQERGIGEQVVGAGEAALTALTGATGGAAGLLGGTLQGVITELRSGEFGSNEAANRIADRAEAAMQELTYAPRTEAGQEYVQAIGEAGEALAPLAGLSGPLQQAGQLGKAARPQVSQAAKTAEQAAKPATDAVKQATDEVKGALKTQGKAKQRIGQLLDAGSPVSDIVEYKLNASGKVVGDRVGAEAAKQGWRKDILASAKTASKADKELMSKMTKIMETGKSNAEYRADNRPSDVVGNVLLEKIKTIRNANKIAGRKIKAESEKLAGEPVDIRDAALNFGDKLDELGVQLVDDGKGGFKPDFSVSQLSPGDRGPLKEVIRLMNIKGQGGVDGLSAHQMKKVIDNNVTFGKSKTGMSGDAERALKQFRTDIDDALDSTFPSYDKANTIYSETIGALDSMQGAIGQKLDLSGGNADKALGTKLKSLLSNNQNRINLLDASKEIESIARKHGSGGKLLLEGSSKGGNSIKKLVMYANELDRMFGAVADSSLAGEVGKVVEGAGVAATSPMGLGDLAIKGIARGAEKARGINEAGAFKAIKELLKEQ